MKSKKLSKGHMKMGSGKRDEQIARRSKKMVKDGLFLSALARNYSGDRETL